MENGVPKSQQSGSAEGQLICEYEGINFLDSSRATRLIKQCYSLSRKNIMAASIVYFHTFPLKKKNKEKQSIFAGIILKYWQESWRGKILVKL